MQFVFVAGGMGIRSGSDTPKLLTEVNGIELHRSQLISIQSFTIEDFSILYLLGHSAEVIENFLKENYEGVINYSIFKEPKNYGTGGALIQGLQHLESEFVLVLGDLYFDFAFNEFVQYCRVRNSEMGIVLHPNGHSFDSDNVLTSSETNTLLNVLPKSKKNTTGIRSNLSVAGIYYFKKFSCWSNSRFCESKLEVLDDLISPNLSEIQNPVGYITTEFVKDTGTPERRQLVSQIVGSNKHLRRSLRIPKPVIFVDKDDTLVQDGDDAAVTLNPKVGRAIQGINEEQIPLIGISNQPRVAKGERLSNAENIFRTLGLKLDEFNAFVDIWYFCPHHPDAGFSEENRYFKVDCKCRKPRTGLIDFAKADHNVEVADSYFIGDTKIDFQLCKNSNLNFLHTTEFSACKIAEKHVCLEDTSTALEYAKNKILTRSGKL